MHFKELLSKGLIKKLICVMLLLILATLSVFVISKSATSPENYRTTIQSIEEKKATVMGVATTAATASIALAAIPGDATTPIANQIMKISSYLMIVVCVLVLEKSLLMVMGYLSFSILIPIACVLLGIYIFVKKKTLMILAIKFIVFALVIVTIIPFSLKISDMIYEVNKSMVEQVTTDVEGISVNGSEEESGLDQMLDKVKNSVSDAGDKAKQILNNFIDAIALFIIAYCAIPIIVILLMIWFIKFLFGITVPVPNTDMKRLAIKNKYDKKSKELSGV